MHDGAALHSFGVGGLSYREKISEDDRMSCEKAAIHSECGVATEEDDISVFEPEVGITLDGIGKACCDGGHLAGLGGRMLGDVNPPSFDDTVGGHQVPAGTHDTKERHESLLSLAISSLWKEVEDVRGLGPTYDVMKLLFSWMGVGLLRRGSGPVGGYGRAWGGRPGGKGRDALEDGLAEAHSVFVVEDGGKVEGEKVGSAASWAGNSDFFLHLCDSHSLDPGATRTASSFLAYHVTEFCPY